LASAAAQSDELARAAAAEGEKPIFLLYQKGRDSRIFQAQDRAIDNFTLKGICGGII
jgi:hypothetical protein